jgi:hypothetical protein
LNGLLVYVVLRALFCDHSVNCVRAKSYMCSVYYFARVHDDAHNTVVVEYQAILTSHSYVLHHNVDLGVLLSPVCFEIIMIPHSMYSVSAVHMLRC